MDVRRLQTSECHYRGRCLPDAAGRRPHRLGEVCHHARSLPRILAGARTRGITAIHGVCNTVRTVPVQSDAVRSTWGSCYVSKNDGQRPARLRRLRSSLSRRCRHTQRQLGGTLAAHAEGSAEAPRSRAYCKTQEVSTSDASMHVSWTRRWKWRGTAAGNQSRGSTELSYPTNKETSSSLLGFDRVLSEIHPGIHRPSSNTHGSITTDRSLLSTEYSNRL